MTAISPIRVGFPTLRIAADGLHALGEFAQTQSDYLSPRPAAVERLRAALQKHDVGIVAHFYMGPQLQGVLSACDWPHIFTSDSLAMADAAIGMVERGCRNIVVMGVDFMSENVRAMLDAAGHEDIPVYRVATDAIGCSLAESALAPAYGAFIHDAAATPNSLHVIYINTSLLTKARAHALVPTITCTSSNVVRTILQAFAQIPDLTVWYGPDTYMGRNLQAMFRRYAALPDAEIRRLHPAHDQASLRRALAGMRVFEQGTCIVHHMFGREVVDRVKASYGDAFMTAHLEVPGEMFALAAEAQRADQGVVGSTSNILEFITRKVDEAVATSPSPSDGPLDPVRFVLGTEAGMITPIVRDVERTLKRTGRDDVAVDIVFPVASEAVTATGDADLAIVPGASGGEGCSTAGGCATCPFMKMNSLANLFHVLHGMGDSASLAGYHPRAYTESIDGRTAADIGSEPILHMRHFQRTGELSADLVAAIAAHAKD